MINYIFIIFMLVINKGQMSFDANPSSAIIFEESENYQTSGEEREPDQIAKSSAIQKIVVKQITTNLIKIKSTPRLKNRSKGFVSDPQYLSGLRKRTDQKIPDLLSPSSYDGQQITVKSETSSNKQTKPTRTQDDQEISEDMIEEITYLTQKTEYKKPDPKQQPLHSQALHPRKAKRQLGGSDDEFEDAMKHQAEQEEQDIDDSEESEQDNNNALRNNNHKYSSKNQIRTSPPIQLSFGREKLKHFIQTPIKPGYQMKCLIQLEDGFLGFASKYHLKQKFESKILISAKKQLMSFTPTIILSFSKHNHSRRNQDYFGILQSNFSGTRWTLICPEVRIPGSEKIVNASQKTEKSVLTACFESSIMGSRSMREMRAEFVDPLLPKEKRGQIDLANLSKRDRNYVMELRTAKPRFEKGKYQLDFKGVAKMASSKNLILCDKTGQQCLVLGKQGEKSYQMNIQYPLSLAQGFSLCLASLEGKLMVN